jgi:hypothetical protein
MFFGFEYNLVSVTGVGETVPAPFEFGETVFYLDERQRLMQVTVTLSGSKDVREGAVGCFHVSLKFEFRIARRTGR